LKWAWFILILVITETVHEYLLHVCSVISIFLFINWFVWDFRSNVGLRFFKSWKSSNLILFLVQIRLRTCKTRIALCWAQIVIVHCFILEFRALFTIWACLHLEFKSSISRLGWYYCKLSIRLNLWTSIVLYSVCKCKTWIRFRCSQNKQVILLLTELRSNLHFIFNYKVLACLIWVSELIWSRIIERNFKWRNQ